MFINRLNGKSKIDLFLKSISLMLNHSMLLRLRSARRANKIRILIV